jgi:hypothetical protein
LSFANADRYSLIASSYWLQASGAGGKNLTSAAKTRIVDAASVYAVAVRFCTIQIERVKAETSGANAERTAKIPHKYCLF